MGKRTYRATDIKNIDVEKLLAALGSRVVMGLDVAKEHQYVALMAEDGTVVRVVKWSHPTETRLFYALCGSLAAKGRRCEVVMEPSGSYGDAIRAGLLKRNVEVFRVSGKRVHDEAEVQDGVPSLHDAKSAVVIATLHLQKKGTLPWPLATNNERELEALRQTLTLHQDRELALQGRVEALMARYWPELLTGKNGLSLTSVTLLELLAEYGGPSKVAANASEARELMVFVGRSFLTAPVIDNVLSSASTTLGVPMLEAEMEHVRAVAAEALRAHRLRAAAEKQLVAKAKAAIKPEVSALLGDVTAATLVASGLDPAKFKSAGAYEKAFGLNLREKSSGKKHSGLHITKRGESVARKVLFLAVLRLIKSDPVVAAWYRKKVARDGGKIKMKAVVAVMRKVVKALWHVGRGHAFEAAKLFDVAKLEVTPKTTSRRTA